jgi:hypothetical protein
MDGQTSQYQIGASRVGARLIEIEQVH